MATYTFRTLEQRKEIQKMYEAGASAAELAEIFGISLSTMLNELSRGYRVDERLPDMRRKYDAELAQLKMQQSFEQRGRRPRKEVPNHASESEG